MDTLTVEREIGFEDVSYEAYTPARVNCPADVSHPAEGGGVESYKAYWVDTGKELTPEEYAELGDQMEELLNDNSESFIPEPDPDAEYDARHER